MKSSKPPATHKPFKDLKALIEKESFPLTTDHEQGPAAETVQYRVQDPGEEEVFQEAMADVEPIARGPVAIGKGQARRPKASAQHPDAEALARLQDLVRGGEGFIISDTPEYMEGIGYGVNPEVARRLHQGDFSIQTHIDLHGFGAGDAQKAFDQFLKQAIMSGKRAVLVIHGRGLSSPVQPVLKTKVKEWLTSGPWQKWVIAFTSARACDGGTGATYVLLRHRPATKRYRKRTLGK